MHQVKHAETLLQSERVRAAANSLWQFRNGITKTLVTALTIIPATRRSGLHPLANFLEFRECDLAPVPAIEELKALDGCLPEFRE